MADPLVIVTRPLAQALPWVTALREAGMAAQALPLIDIRPLAEGSTLVQAWSGLPRHQLVMFVSPNAVEHFMAARPAAQAWPAQTLAGSTGPGTSAALRGAGVPEAALVEPLPGAPYDTESLWARLRSRNWAGCSVLIVRGEDGRDWFADQLRAAGAAVDCVAAYRRVPPRLDTAQQALLDRALADAASHLWLFSSSEAIGHLKALRPQADWSKARALASHARIARTALEAGFADVRLVEPTPAAVVDACRAMRGERTQDALAREPAADGPVVTVDPVRP